MSNITLYTMLNILLAVLSFIGAMAYVLLLFAIIIIVLFLLFAYATNPSNESFEEFIKHEINKQTQSRILTHFTKKMFDKEIKNYIFFKVATINNIYNPKKEHNMITFLGIFQLWSRFK